MDLRKNHAACVAVILACCGWTARAAQPYPNSCRDGCCPRGVDCIPKRSTYGFTPTKWRTWPAAEKPAAAQSGPENLPTPAKELPKAEAESSQSPSEDSPLLPTENEPAIPQTPGGLPPDGLFDDTPPSPPRESGGMGEPPSEPPESADGLPGVSPQIQLPAPEDADKPPAMEDEDPFKDDPIPHIEAPPADAPPRGATNAKPARNSIQTSDWRVGNKGQANPAESRPTMRAADLDEPGLLRDDPDRHAGRQMLPIQALDRRNPLRSKTVKHEDSKIVPTADWSVEPVALSDTAGSRSGDGAGQGASDLLPVRRNPLRSETNQQHENQVVPAAATPWDQVESNDAPVAWKRNPLRTN